MPQKNLCSTSLWHFRKYCRICEKANTRSLRPTPTPARAKTARSGDPGSRADDCARSLYGRRDDEPWEGLLRFPRLPRPHGLGLGCFAPAALDGLQFYFDSLSTCTHVSAERPQSSRLKRLRKNSLIEADSSLQGLKPEVIKALTARLKSCPDTCRG